jgi:hypothetical protein
VGVDIGESDLPAMPSGTEQASQHDAAVAPQDNHESPAVETDRDMFRETPTVGGDPRFVPCPAGWTREIHVGRRYHVAEVGGA